MKHLILFVLIIFCTQLFSTDLYFGPGQRYTNFEAAFATAMSGDHLIDCTLKDMKILPGNHWSWISFPRLERIYEKYADARTVLSNFQNYPFPMDLMYSDIIVLEYNFQWNPARYDIRSSLGYKLNPQKSGTHHLSITGTKLPSDTKLKYSLPAKYPNWVGYWIPYTQNIMDAFGDIFDNVLAVEAEDWFYISSDFASPSSSTISKNFEYGKGYIIYFEEPIKNFQWNNSKRKIPELDRSEPQYFSTRDLPNYAVIDVMDIPQNVIEIGVFEDDLCVGAVVVQDTCKQILVYSGNVLRDPIPFSFEIVTNNREAGTPITSYQVLNKETGLFEERSLISGQQKSSVIMFGNLEDPQNNTPVIDNVVLHGNYPNPFNPETKISFSLSQDQEIELTVYNLKGQKVRTLYTGNTSSGEQSVVWNGKDDDGKHVGSGLYFYKLRTEDKELTKKMLLLK
ncbi:MAG: T9SS type A sorting domain-containing protein [Candidatus Cloacimonetes bacterium]|nr:T9SS type A sorting domain-containing protein [Candidatus Cloacimonadota bacterium]